MHNAHRNKAVITLWLGILGFLGSNLLQAAEDSPPPLPVEEIGNVVRLPASYPEHWMMIDEASFFSMYGGKVIILDVLEKHPAKRIKGMVHKNLLGNFTQHPSKPEFYVLESFHERGWRGKKTDVFVVYDRETLKIQKEIVWPTHRMQTLPQRYTMAVTGDEKFIVAANFTPAASFSVVSVDGHELLSTIGTPGCVLTYPTGKRSVSSLCSNGGMLTTVLDRKGQVKAQHRIEPFFDSDDTPIFERPVIVDQQAYFPSFKGKMHHFDFSGEVAEYKGSWSLVSDEEAAANWRPSGLGLIDQDEQGLVYVIMQPDGAEGTQTHGGSQIWVFDVAKQQRLNVIDVPNWAITLGVTRGKEPKIVVTNGELVLDVLDAASGELIQTIADFGNVTPLMLHKSY